MKSNIVMKIWDQEFTAKEFVEKMKVYIENNFDAEITQMVCDSTVRKRYEEGERDPLKLIENPILGYRFVTIDGFTRTIFDWCKQFEVIYLLVSNRYHDRGVRGADLFAKPTRCVKRKFYKGLDDVNLAITDKERRTAMEKHGVVE